MKIDTNPTIHDEQCVLCLYITKVSGHRQASMAIKSALQLLKSETEVPVINGFGYAFPVLEKVVHNTYMAVIHTIPQLWDRMYDNPKFIGRTQFLKKLLYRASHRKIGKLLTKYKPRTVVATQAFPCALVSDYKKRFNYDVQLVGVLTDFSPHAYWINDCVDYYVVPCQEAKDYLIQAGRNPDRIKVYGIPLHPKFNVPLDRRLISESLDLDPDVPTVLIMGGGHGLGPIKNIVQSLLEQSHNIQMVVTAGKNKKVVSELKDITRGSDKKVLIYEFANNVNELMEISSLIVTKPGGITTAESLSKGLPMVIVNPLPGQEMLNTKFLTEKGIALQIDDPTQIGQEIARLLNSPQKLSAMRRCALKHSKPNSSIDIARLILGKPEHKPSAQPGPSVYA